MEFVLQFLAAGVIFAVIDAIWIGVVANSFYKSEMGKLLRDKPDFVPAVIFYLIYILGMVVFAIRPALEQGSWTVALGLGALLGLVAYATYDLTNASTLKNWSKKVTLVDLAWGTGVTAVVSVLTYLVFSL